MEMLREATAEDLENDEFGHLTAKIGGRGKLAEKILEARFLHPGLFGVACQARWDGFWERRPALLISFFENSAGQADDCRLEEVDER